jgi:predicted dehydrogenase
MARRIDRRQFIGQTAAAGAGFWCSAGLKNPLAALSPNEKVRVAFVGVGGRGEGDLNETMQHPIAEAAALCDVDSQRLDKAAAKHPRAKKFQDYRKMIDECAKEFDAIVVATPDHHHVFAAAQAMKLGKHAYVEKPLTHSISEARLLTQLAKEKNLVTQMGNQGHSSGSRRKLVEFLQQGGLGKVSEVHVWTNRPIWPQAIDRPKESHPVPAHLDWDLWLGPAPERPYRDKAYAHFNWRGWWDFGTVALGDMACHMMDAAFWGLGLGYPTAVEAEGEPLHPESGPAWMTVRLQFPARGEQPPVKYTWYDGKKGDVPNMPTGDLSPGVKLKNGGNLIVGEKGTVVVLDDQTGDWKVIWKDGKVQDKKEIEAKETLRRVGEHHLDWLEGIRGGPKPYGEFAYSGPFTETVLIGIAAFRSGKKLEWDGPNMKATNTRDADQYIKREYRKGWTL